jgi:hypothetical protein
MLQFNKISSPRSFVLVWLYRQGANFQIKAGKVVPRRKELSSFNTIEEVVEEFGVNKPYVIHVSGSGVVQRTLENKPNYITDLIINGRKEDFFITSFQSFDKKNVTVSFFRREVIEELLNILRSQKVKLYQVDSGEIQLIKSLGDVFYLKGSFDISSSVDGEVRVNKTEQPPRLIQTSSGTYTYEELLIESYTNVSDQQIELWNYSFLESPWNDRSEIKGKRTFERFGAILMTTLLLIVFGNYFYQNYLYQDISKLESELLIQNDNLALLDRLNLEKERKKILVGNAGIFTPRFNAYYLDEIGLTVPKDIVLTKLELYPIDGKLKQKQKINVFRDLIKVQGTTPTNIELDKWISILDKKEWVKTVEVMNYIKNDSLPAEFNIQIRIKE